MSIRAVTHLNFHGEAREALEFYGSVFGGDPKVTTYGDLGMPADRPDAGKVVFGMVHATDGFQVLAYDIPSGAGADGAPRRASQTRREQGMTVTDSPFFVAVSGDTVEEVQVFWERMSVDATVIEEYGPTQWAPAFGMLTDRFGVTWILNVMAG